MAITVTYAGGFGDKSSALTTAVDTLSSLGVSTVPAGSLMIVGVCADNAGTSGASSITTPTDSVGSTYTLVRAQNRTAASAASDGVTVALYKTITAGALTSTSTITANFSPATTARTVIAFWVQGANSTEYETNGASGTGTTYTDPVSASMAVGDLIICLVGNESATNPAVDTDTTGGSWSGTLQGCGGSGGDATKICLEFQYKVVTGAGTQQCNGTTGASTDWASVHALYTVASVPAPSLVPPTVRPWRRTMITR